MFFLFFFQIVKRQDAEGEEVKITDDLALSNSSDVICLFKKQASINLSFFANA
jgi:hypothetical protein